jgi:hypothetical protein
MVEECKIEPEMGNQNQRNETFPRKGTEKPHQPPRNRSDKFLFEEADLEKKVAVKPPRCYNRFRRRVAIEEQVARNQKLLG